MCTLMYLKQITTKDPLYSTGSSAQCYVAVWKGAGFGGEWIHVYVWLRPFSVHLTLSQHGLLTGYSLIQNKKLISLVGTNISELGVKFLEAPGRTNQDLQ